MKKNKLAIILTGIMLSSLFTGCGGEKAETPEPAAESSTAAQEQQSVDISSTETASDSEAVTVTYANFNASGGNEETLNKMYEAFHEEHPNITVDIETIGYDDYFTQMQTRVAGGTAPDCYELNIENFAAYANKGALAELTGIDVSSYNATALSAFQIDGAQYGVPGSIWAFGTFADACDFNWDICVEPGGTQKATHFFSNALVVNANSAKKEAAATWINWLASSEDAAKMRIEAGWELPAVSNESVLSGYLAITPPNNRQAVFDSLNDLVVAPIIEDYSLMADIITDKLSLAASGELTVEEALNEAQAECSSQIKLQ